jgi:hypothetical protein
MQLQLAVLHQRHRPRLLANPRVPMGYQLKMKIHNGTWSGIMLGGCPKDDEQHRVLILGQVQPIAMNRWVIPMRSSWRASLCDKTALFNDASSSPTNLREQFPKPPEKRARIIQATFGVGTCSCSYDCLDDSKISHAPAHLDCHCNCRIPSVTARYLV